MEHYLHTREFGAVQGVAPQGHRARLYVLHAEREVRGTEVLYGYLVGKLISTEVNHFRLFVICNGRINTILLFQKMQYYDIINSNRCI